MSGQGVTFIDSEFERSDNLTLVTDSNYASANESKGEVTSSSVLAKSVKKLRKALYLV